MGKYVAWVILFLGNALRGMDLDGFPESFFDDLGSPFSMGSLSPFGEEFDLDGSPFLSDSSFSEGSPILDWSPPPLTPNIGDDRDLEEELKFEGFTLIASPLPMTPDPESWPTLEQYAPQALRGLPVDFVRASVLLPPKPLMLTQKRKRGDEKEKNPVLKNLMNIQPVFIRFVNLKSDQRLTIQNEAREIYESSEKTMIATEIQKHLEGRHCRASGSDIIFDAITNRVIHKWILKWNASDS